MEENKSKIERYIVVMSGLKNNKPYSILHHIVSGTKDDGSVFEFATNKSTQRESEQMPVGTILEYQTIRVPKKTTLSINNKIKED